MPISNLRISPIGGVPKSDGSIRLITHLSHPQKTSVNDFISNEFACVKYSSFDKVIDMFADLGNGARIGKMDIKSAFRLLPLNPEGF